MAKFNPIKVKQEADKHEKSGRFDPAIACYKQIVEHNKRDWNSINKIGDLYAKQNKLQDAGREYAKVAEFYAQDGFLLKAIAIWKKINKLDSTALDPYLNLADLYGKQGLMMEAKSQYQIVVDEYIKRGKGRDAADVLRRMVEIDPTDLKTRSKLADLYTRDGNRERAVEEYVAIADELNKKGHLAEALQVLEKGLKLDASSARLREQLARIHMLQKNFERAAEYLEEAARAAPDDVGILGRLGEAYLGAKKIPEASRTLTRLLELEPDNLETRARVGQLYLLQGELDRAFEELAPVVDRLLEQRQGDEATGLLQQIIQKDPAHVRSLVKLVELQRIQQNDRAVIETYSQLVEAYVKAQQLDQAASILEILIGLEPENQQYKSKLEFVQGKLSGGSAPPPSTQPAPEPEMALDEEFDLSLDGEAASEAAMPAAPPPATTAPPASRPAPAASDHTLVVPDIELSGALSPEDQEFVDEHVAEGKVFSKYGLIDKALDQFEAIIARFPDNAEAREELALIHEDREELLEGARHRLALMQIFRLQNEPDKVERQEAEARRLGGDVVVAALQAAGLGAAAAAQPVAEDHEFPLEGPAGDVEALERGEQVAAAPAAMAGEDEFDLDEAPGEAAPAGRDQEEELSLDEFDLDEAVDAPGAAPEAPSAGDDAPQPPPAEPADAEEDLRFELDEPVPSQPAARPSIDDGFALDLDLPGTQDQAQDAGSSALDALTEAEPAPPPAPPAEISPLDDLAAPEPTAGGEDDLLSGLADAPSAIASDSLLDDLAGGLPESAPPPDTGLGDALGLEMPSPLVAREAPEPPGATLAADLPEDLQRALEEVETYMGLGFVEDAKGALREISVRYPGHAAIQATLDELGLDASALGAEAPALPDSGGDIGDLLSEGAAPAPAGGEAGDMLDLGSELSDLFGAQEAVDPNIVAITGESGDASLSDILSQFKKGVDKQLSQEDYDTRYNLGIAYKEMNLLDEAIAEFQKAAKDPARLLECASMLGICFLEKGMPALAVKWFEKGLAAEGRAPEEYQGLRYDLALAYEAVGDSQEALAMFLELYGQDATFRDVATRVRELRAAQG